MAKALDVGTPRVLACSRADELPATWPAAWGTDLVVKPLEMWNSQGVLLIRNGVNAFTTGAVAGEPMRGRNDVLAAYAKAAVNASAPVIVEELLPPADSTRSRGTKVRSPDDFKFFMFGGKVGTVWHVHGRKTREECSAWYDASWSRRLDQAGCVK